MVRDLYDFFSQNTESTDAELNYQKFVLHKSRVQKPNLSAYKIEESRQRKKSYAFGSSTDRSKEDIKLPPVLSYEISYSQVDVNIPKVRIQERNNDQSKTRFSTESNIVKVRKTQKTKSLRGDNTIQRQPQRSFPLELERPNEYFPAHPFQPMSNTELKDLFQSLLSKHRVRKPTNSWDG
ncbi:unnamed protein product (macronuclear) [Paramecium tetraurelia]|uniref:Uncharacterized protein n=1 Tax=Paramecium tetraurelia TaxID=5888 RepID=A0E5S5_PARTE|nr:uncharacterized protein GSPATT00003504001 [Paramecium tetraurelia]CAK90642.1 unnamed protein product [Paramecium tetraurelia]|eukprot:XP_001458039.1 hypothetical protein (macronuclear) [Paramecium tetraurelia strain d4-2]